MSCDLQDVGVLVTRPSGQAEGLCQAIAQHGGRPICFPTITIGPPEDCALAKEIIQGIDRYHIVIFISSNAVKYSLKLLDKADLSIDTMVCAVGKTTARALSERGIGVDVSPDGPFDSETLLAMPELANVSGKHILILRGNGGRRLLGDTLQERGAEVEYVEVYSRKIASIDAGPLIASWGKEVDIVTATSCGILENLFTIVGEEGHAVLCKTPLVVVSERIKTRARKLGCEEIILAKEASDQGVLAAICEWAAVTSR
jgi:uroporphyrinogen-III synthase